MKRSELEKLIESLLVEGLLAEGFDIGFGSEEDSEEDKDAKDPDEDIDDSLLDDDDDLLDDDDASLVPSGGSSIKRVASAIADKVSKAYTGTKKNSRKSLRWHKGNSRKNL